MGSGSRRLVLSPQELRTAIEVARQDGLLTQGEKEMINYILEFKETWVSDILTARIDIEGISVGMTQGEVLEFLKEKKHSKLPVYEGSLDNIIGVLYAKELFLDPGKDYRRLLRQPLLVPASRRIDDLLKTFLETQERMAVVLDEYGGTAGLVTLEDVQEEIFGEIYGEFETPRPDIEKIGEGFYRVNARSPVKNVNLTLDLGLPDEEVTVAGFILSRLEKIPRSQEKLRFKNAEFIVERATARRIITVLVKIDGRS
jgi:putative hemolysin